MMSFLKTRLKNLYHSFKNWRKYAWPMLRWKFLHPHSVFYVFTPMHGNMGDQAITYAEKKMLNKWHIGYFEIPGALLYKLNALGYLSKMNGMPILFHGGGYIGSLVPRNNDTVCDILRSNPDSRVLFFPHTIVINDDATLKKTTSIFNTHKNLSLYVRESISYNKFKNCFNNIKLVPDSVLLLDMQKNRSKRNGLLLCMRNDMERTLSDKEESELAAIAKKYYGNNIITQDMNHNHDIPLNQRQDYLDRMFALFNERELVITDRLHGALYAVVTGTPCIILPSMSHKILGTYNDWLSTLGYIHYAENVQSIEKFIKSPRPGNFKIKAELFAPIIEELKEFGRL